MSKNNNSDNTTSDNTTLQDIISHVTGHLTAEDTARIKETSKSVKDAIEESDTTRLNITFPDQKVDAKIGGSVRGLRISNKIPYLADPNIANAISLYPKLESLEASGSSFSKKSLIAINQVKSLSKLDISFCTDIRKEHIIVLEENNNLKTLDISRLTRVDNETIISLCNKFPNLEELYMIGTGNTKMRLSENELLDNDVMIAISGLKSLKVLDIKDKMIDNFNNIQTLVTNLPNIEKIELTTQETVTDAQKANLDEIIEKRIKSSENKSKRKVTSSPSPTSAQPSKRSKTEEKEIT
jgi:hypothetical protein